jgi:hypothetical protein
MEQNNELIIRKSREARRFSVVAGTSQKPIQSRVEKTAPEKR